MSFDYFSLLSSQFSLPLTKTLDWLFYVESGETDFFIFLPNSSFILIFVVTGEGVVIKPGNGRDQHNMRWSLTRCFPSHSPSLASMKLYSLLVILHTFLFSIPMDKSLTTYVWATITFCGFLYLFHYLQRYFLSYFITFWKEKNEPPDNKYFSMEFWKVVAKILCR